MNLGAMWNGLSLGAKGAAVGAGLLALPLAAKAASDHPVIAAGIALGVTHGVNPNILKSAVAGISKRSGLGSSNLQKLGIKREFSGMKNSILDKDLIKDTLKPEGDTAISDEVKTAYENLNAHNNMGLKHRILNKQLGMLRGAQTSLEKMWIPEENSQHRIKMAESGAVNKFINKLKTGIDRGIVSAEEKLASINGTQTNYAASRTTVDKHMLETAVRGKTGKGVAGQYEHIKRFQGNEFMSAEEIKELEELDNDSLMQRLNQTKAKADSRWQNAGAEPAGNPLSARDIQEHSLLALRAHQQGLIESEDVLSHFGSIGKSHATLSRPQARNMQSFYHGGVRELASMSAKDLDAQTLDILKTARRNERAIPIFKEKNTRALGRIKDHHGATPGQVVQESYDEELQRAIDQAGNARKSKNNKSNEARAITRYMVGI